MEFFLFDFSNMSLSKYPCEASMFLILKTCAKNQIQIRSYPHGLTERTFCHNLDTPVGKLYPPPDLPIKIPEIKKYRNYQGKKVMRNKKSCGTKKVLRNKKSPAEHKNAELKNANLVQNSHSFIPHFSGILDQSQSFIPHFLNSRLHFFQCIFLPFKDI